ATGGVPPARATANGQDLGTAPTDVTTATDGTIRIGYTVGGKGGPQPPNPNVSDVITAQDKQTGPTVTGSDSHPYSIVSYAFRNGKDKSDITGQSQSVSVDGPPICLEVTTQNIGDQVYLTSSTSTSVSGSFTIDPSQ